MELIKKRNVNGQIAPTHGLSKHPLYGVWADMRKRCYNHASPDYPRYGARGIAVCSQWEDFAEFYDWAISAGYARGLVIDRIDNDSGYSPENCRFVDRKQSSRNRRNTLFVAGKSTGEWAEISGMDTKRVKDLALKLGEREFVERMNANPD